MATPDTSSREIVITRLLNAPRELVFKVWTEPEHLKKWWGPDGFTTTIHQMDVKPGGTWTLTMHGPDGTDYKNKSVFREVSPSRIVFDHESGPKFTSTITFKAVGNKTRITMHMVFRNDEEFRKAVETFGAIEGAEQTFNRLEKHMSLLTNTNI